MGNPLGLSVNGVSSGSRGAGKHIMWVLVTGPCTPTPLPLWVPWLTPGGVWILLYKSGRDPLLLSVFRLQFVCIVYTRVFSLYTYMELNMHAHTSTRQILTRTVVLFLCISFFMFLSVKYLNN